ncbi:MAG TPA: hypothetical protein IAB02_09235 [Candidatus Pullichristensenella excrementigallinarum]|uniref:Uncharacterized protein n=1 Tax=Candidatus Pullichristensenella excrementigallinarum TaxID=2840907 RepID=A0A9D1ICJ0_9FIRM|nr:hypothetical protein [Candidatus Pullichristensenella excrementigallinarum]
MFFLRLRSGKAERDVLPPRPCVSKKDFDTHHENLRIFMEEEEACGNLKISGFSGRFPDGQNCFSCAYAPKKPSATYCRRAPGRVAESNFCGTPILQTNQEKDGGIASKSKQPKQKEV